ncbi:class I SAM-dependent methyltransferase [Roseateles sp. P5_D6]
MSASAADAGTATFYDGYATQLAATEASRSAMLPLLEAALPPGAWVLDVGAGSGRDVAALQQAGFEAFGVEPNATMRETALRLRPDLAGRLRDASLPQLGTPFSDCCPQGFDAVACSAVLMHIAPADLPGALASLARQLRPLAAGDVARCRPALLIALPEMNPGQLSGDRDADGRRFHNHAPATLQRQLTELGLMLESSSVNDAVLASTDTRWHMLVFRRI